MENGLLVRREKRTRFKAILKPEHTPKELHQTCSKTDSNPIEPDSILRIAERFTPSCSFTT